MAVGGALRPSITCGTSAAVHVLKYSRCRLLCQARTFHTAAPASTTSTAPAITYNANSNGLRQQRSSNQHRQHRQHCTDCNDCLLYHHISPSCSGSWPFCMSTTVPRTMSTTLTGSQRLHATQ